MKGRAKEEYSYFFFCFLCVSASESAYFIIVYVVRKEYTHSNVAVDANNSIADKLWYIDLCAEIRS